MVIERRFALTDHCCRACAGRILERNGTFMCADCEAYGGTRVETICGCGVRGEPALPKPLRGAFRCGINPARGQASPSRIVILYGGVVAA